METGMHGRGFERSGTGGGRADEVKQKATDLGRTAREKAMTALDQQKSQVSGLLDRIADSVQDDRIGAYAAGYARRGAELLRGRSADDLVSTLGRELRARPGVLLSAAFVAGLAIARLARATGESGARGWGGGGLDFDGRRRWQGGE